MRTQALMFIALFVAAGAFAQTANVKHDQQVKAGSNANVNATAGNQQLTAGTSASSATSTGSATAVNGNQVNGQATAAHQQEAAVAVDPAAVTNTAGAVKSNVESNAKAGVNTTSQLVKQTAKQGNTAVQQLSNTATGATRNAVQMNGAINNTLKIKAAPIKVSTLTSGAVGLGGL